MLGAQGATAVTFEIYFHRASGSAGNSGAERTAMKIKIGIVTIASVFKNGFIDNEKRVRTICTFFDKEGREYRAHGDITGFSLVSEGNTVGVRYVEAPFAPGSESVERVVYLVDPVEADADSRAEYEEATANAYVLLSDVVHRLAKSHEIAMQSRLLAEYEEATASA